MLFFRLYSTLQYITVWLYSTLQYTTPDILVVSIEKCPRRCCLRALLQHRFPRPVQHSSQLPSLQQDAGADVAVAVTATASHGATVKRGMAVGFTVETHGGTGELGNWWNQEWSKEKLDEIGWNELKWVEMSKCWWGYWGYYVWSFKGHLKVPITNQMFFGSVYFACCECLVGRSHRAVNWEICVRFHSACTSPQRKPAATTGSHIVPLLRHNEGYCIQVAQNAQISMENMVAQWLFKAVNQLPYREKLQN